MNDLWKRNFVITLSYLEIGLVLLGLFFLLLLTYSLGTNNGLIIAVNALNSEIARMELELQSFTPQWTNWSTTPVK
jgi:hypothetical protein